MFNAMIRAEIWLQETIGKQISINELADHLGYSDSQVRRQFRHYFDTSPSAYRDQRRLEHAAVLLALTPKNIAQIALVCGYYNHSSFSRAFHKHFSVSPRHFRQSIRRTLQRQRPPSGFTTRIIQKPQRQFILRRYYKAPEQLKGLGTAELHTESLPSLPKTWTQTTPSIALPDLLTEKIGARVAPSAALPRTDVGFCLASQEALALKPSLPMTYRRMTLAPQHYAITCFDDFSALSHALTHALYQLLCHPTPFYISGAAPYVLWRKTSLELRLPLSK
ncbi:helix-turn-helix domain-containing protein [Halomonas alkaliantarctica]|nr:helix-turn-helix domain-containing protein [Halomonas alkaliantarctica]